MLENRLMHDGQKTRNGSVIVYQEHVTQERLDELLEEMGVKIARSPLHDKDKYDKNSVRKWERSHKDPTPEELERKPKVGEYKKAHWHVPFQLTGPRTLANILDMFPEELHVTSVWKEPDPEHAIRYMCHLDSKNKEKYSIDGVEGFGGIDLSPLERLTEQDKANDIAFICKHIKEDEVTNFYDLANWVIQGQDYQLFTSIVSRTTFYKNYMDGLAVKLGKKRG